MTRQSCPALAGPVRGHHEETESPRIRADHHAPAWQQRPRPGTLFGQAPTVMTPSSVKPVVVASSNGNRSKDADSVTCVAEGVQDDDRRRRRARCARRRRRDRRARSESDRRRLERSAERRWRRSARCVLHARTQEARRCRCGDRRRPDAGEGRPARRRRDRSSSAGGQGRAGLRACDGLQDRRGPHQRERPEAMARVEASHRSAALSRSEEARAGVVRRRPADGARRARSTASTSGAPSTATASTPKARSAV